MKRWLRRYLGIDEIQEDQAFLSRKLDEILDKGTALQDEMLGMRSDLTMTFKDEHSPERKAISDRLGQRAIQRLKAEDMARKLMTGGE